VTYLECELHSSSYLTIHLSLFKDLIIIVVGSLTNINDSPSEAVLQVLDRFEVNIESDGRSEWSFGLVYNHVEYIYE
jgi:hypothetical protein